MMTRFKTMMLLAAALAFGLSACDGGGGNSGETACSDGQDNDGDGFVDCADADCLNQAVCNATCGNGLCETTGGESAATCQADCTCGDTICDASETNATCPADCSGGVCGDSVCDPGEDANTCPADCTAVCGNGACEAGEDAMTCPNDCGVAVCDDPNDLIAGTGCNPGQACTVIDTQGSIGCQTEGPHQFYEDCSDQQGCVNLSGCFGSGPGDFACLPFCDLQIGNCPGGGLCLFVFQTTNGDVGLCALPDQCDALNNAGCDPGEGCYFANANGDTVCSAEGAVAEGTACQFTNDCMARHTCAGNPGVCRELCDLGAPNCANAATTCQDAGLPAPTGVCNP